MSVFECTSRISQRWLERKTKADLARIIMANLDKIDLFADESKQEIRRLRIHRDALAFALREAIEVLGDSEWGGEPRARMALAAWECERQTNGRG